jgi:photoactive yellow protein
MEIVHLENINLSEVLPRINDINVLPFGLVKMDLTGKVLEYNMAEAEMTGTDPAWAIGKNFFAEVATCTNTPAFYGKFVEGVKKGFLNSVFNYSFTHCEIPIRVRVHMVTMPDSRGQKIVVMMVTRVHQTVHITDAFRAPIKPSGVAPAPTEDAASLSDAAAKGIANAILSAANHQSVQLASAGPSAGNDSSSKPYR